MVWKLLPIITLAVTTINFAFGAIPPQLTRDGTAEIWGFPGVSYKAVNYLPVCGTLSLSDSGQYDTYTLGATCDASMSVYNETASTSAVYDYTGTPSDENIADGTPLCMCFSLGGAQGRMDMCINILGDGKPEGRWTVSWSDVVAGTFVSNSNKALPQCSEVNVKSVSSSVYARLGAKQATTTAAPEAAATDNAMRTTAPPEAKTTDTAIRTTTGGETKTSAASGPESSALATTASPGKSEKSDEIALGVGLGSPSHFTCSGGIANLSLSWSHSSPPWFARLIWGVYINRGLTTLSA
ncbi:MAG: hypothetical protein Q9169_004475 [Polycauliona sp. 2 TL-2023]